MKCLSNSQMFEMIDALIAANDGELPDVAGLLHLKCNHGPGYNQYGGKNGIGEGIWVAPVAGDAEDGFGILDNDSFNYGVVGDLVQYQTYDPACNPIIVSVVPGRAYREVTQRFFERRKAERTPVKGL